MKDVRFPIIKHCIKKIVMVSMNFSSGNTKKLRVKKKNLGVFSLYQFQSYFFTKQVYFRTNCKMVNWDRLQLELFKYML